MHRGSDSLITFESMKTIISYFIIAAVFLNISAPLSAGNILTHTNEIPIQLPHFVVDTLYVTSFQTGEAIGDPYFLSNENQSPDTLQSHEKIDCTDHLVDGIIFHADGLQCLGKVIGAVGQASYGECLRVTIRTVQPEGERLLRH